MGRPHGVVGGIEAKNMTLDIGFTVLSIPDEKRLKFRLKSILVS